MSAYCFQRTSVIIIPEDVSSAKPNYTHMSKYLRLHSIVFLWSPSLLRKCHWLTDRVYFSSRSASSAAVHSLFRIVPGRIHWCMTHARISDVLLWAITRNLFAPFSFMFVQISNVVFTWQLLYLAFANFLSFISNVFHLLIFLLYLLQSAIFFRRLENSKWMYICVSEIVFKFRERWCQRHFLLCIYCYFP